MSRPRGRSEPDRQGASAERLRDVKQDRKEGARNRNSSAITGERKMMEEALGEVVIRHRLLLEQLTRSPWRYRKGKDLGVHNKSLRVKMNGGGKTVSGFIRIQTTKRRSLYEAGGKR